MGDAGGLADLGEGPGLMEPLLIREAAPQRGQLLDLVVELVGRAAGFRRSLSPGLQLAVVDLVRAMNCYYSNLIEGHNTHPVEIERALQNDYSHDPSHGRRIVAALLQRGVLVAASPRAPLRPTFPADLPRRPGLPPAGSRAFSPSFPRSKRPLSCRLRRLNYESESGGRSLIRRHQDSDLDSAAAKQGLPGVNPSRNSSQGRHRMLLIKSRSLPR